METTLQTRELGTTGLSITPIGFGAWALGGGDWKFGWGDQDDTESVAAIHRALEHGVNWIDTAAVYGFGRSEEVVAKALDGISERPLVFTKCGLVRGDNDDGSPVENITRASIVAECEASLRRLRVETIDLYQIHWPTDEIAEIDEAWAAMEELRTSGKVRAIGVSNFNVEEMERAEAIAPIGSLQPPYSLVKRRIERAILPHCAQKNIGVIVYSPMQSGLLSGAMTRERIAALPQNDWRAASDEFREPKLTRNLAIVDRLEAVGARHGKSAGEVAIAWTLRDPVVTGAIVGGRSAKQVDGVIGAPTFRLTPEEIAEIEA